MLAKAHALSVNKEQQAVSKAYRRVDKLYETFNRLKRTACCITVCREFMSKLSCNIRLKEPPPEASNFVATLARVLHHAMQKLTHLKPVQKHLPTQKF